MSILKLQYHPELLSRIYGVNITVRSLNEEQRLMYKVKIAYGGILYDNFHLLQITKFDYHINEKQPDEHAFRLANECMKAFFPINVIVNKLGLIEAIQSDEIFQRWEAIKPSLKQQFNGKGAEEYIRRTEQILQEEFCVQKLIHKDMFFNVFFKLLYKDGIINSQTTFPLIPFNDVLRFSCTQEISNDKESPLIISRKGLMNDKKKIGMIFPKECHSIKDFHSSINGCFNIKYQLDNSLLIDKITANFKLESNDFKKEYHMKVHYLNEYNVLPVSIPKMEYLGKSLEEKKTFSSILKRIFQ